LSPLAVRSWSVFGICFHARNHIKTWAQTITTNGVRKLKYHI
jgi:hypothetical protein